MKTFMSMRLPIKTKRLYITEFNDHMAESVYRNSIDEDNRRFLPDEVFETREDARNILTSLISNYKRNDAPLVYPVFLNNGTHIGHVEAVPLTDGWEIGYHVAQSYAGNGYATEAVTAFLPPVMRRLGISQIQGVCRVDNTASKKVLEKCGFTRVYDEVAPYHGERHKISHYIFRNGEHMTHIKQRRYDILSDFHKVYHFLEETYDYKTLNSYLLPHYWEYAHYLQWFDYIRAHRMGLWEDDGNLVGIAAYEMEVGKAHLHTSVEYRRLLPELLRWSENELSVIKDGRRTLGVWTTDQETEKRELLGNQGYRIVHTEPVKIFRFGNTFSNRQLPDGFYLTDGTDVDYAKLAECFWRGFDHDEVPPEVNIDGNIKTANAPHADKSLTTVVVAPCGEYACALGMWVDRRNKYAYLEPLATVPKYRRMGLATVALTAAMKKTQALGAEYCFGGGREFYTAIGFEHTCDRELWERAW